MYSSACRPYSLNEELITLSWHQLLEVIFAVVAFTSVVHICLGIHFVLETENNNHSRTFDQCYQW